MSYRENDIVHENGDFFVLKFKTGYMVFKNGVTHASSDGVEYNPDDDGLSIAKAYCDYRAKREAQS